ncbi:hypothetical protein DCC39_06280 [Pueribacillus theae]|uniref:Uncharacterized protein n=1 Tax=Pueribacillus theae TaxID=2171751 RepID=A0A2U1K560_9BACI|nr:hypothetical protein DCC39_06280 [Pueribacillus theae]
MFRGQKPDGFKFGKKQMQFFKKRSLLERRPQKTFNRMFKKSGGLQEVSQFDVITGRDAFSRTTLIGCESLRQLALPLLI